MLIFYTDKTFWKKPRSLGLKIRNFKKYIKEGGMSGTDGILIVQEKSQARKDNRIILSL